MAYEEQLAERVRGILGDDPDLTEKKMFGGLAFLVAGNMAVGVIGDELIVRVDPVEYDTLMAQDGTREFDFSGRPMKGWITVGGAPVASARPLRTWVERGVAYARSLPPK